MKERPMLLCGPMVRAVKERKKTQTRRVVKFARAAIPSDEHHYMGASDQAYAQILSQWGVAQFGCDGDAAREDNTHLCAVRCPYGVPGDRLWVRETFRRYGNVGRDHAAIRYRADNATVKLPYKLEYNPLDVRWKPSIHMPRWASRILLEVTEVRVERVQEITDADAEAEGVDITNASIPGYLRERFRRLWDSINAKRGEKIKIGDPWDGWIWGTSPGDDPEALALDIGKPGEIRWRNLADHDEAEWMRFADSQPTGKGMYDVIWEKGDEPMRVYLEKCPEKEGVNYKLLKFDWGSNPWVWVIGFKLLEVKA